MRKLFLFILLSLLSRLSDMLMAQNTTYTSSDRAASNPEAEDESGLNRWFFNGNISPWIGNPTSINVSPMVGYRVTGKYLVGTGIFYNYFRQRTRFDLFQTSSYGLRLFNNYLVTDQLFMGAEWDYMSYEPYDGRTGQKMNRRWIHVPLVGGGYTARLGQRGRVFVALMYNLNYTPVGPYGNFVPRMSFAF